VAFKGSLARLLVVVARAWEEDVALAAELVAERLARGARRGAMVDTPEAGFATGRASGKGRGRRVARGMLTAVSEDVKANPSKDWWEKGCSL